MARAVRVQTYSIDELQTLCEYASLLIRMLMLLGLNCGFDAKMISTLQPEDIYFFGIRHELSLIFTDQMSYSPICSLCE